MGWVLSPEPSTFGEHVGGFSRFGFVGTRFSIDKDGLLYLMDYDKNKTYHNDAAAYVRQLRGVVGPSWTGRIRIRANGDTYCATSRGIVYVGNTSLGRQEHFPGYILGANREPCNLPRVEHPLGSEHVPSLYYGPHNPFQVGERWTIPDSKFAIKKGKLGKVGQRDTPGNWMWTESKHSDFIGKMGSVFRLEKYLRFYITCYGYVIRPITGRYWDYYGIEINGEYIALKQSAPRAAQSFNNRKRSMEDDINVYFVCGHYDDLMGGELPRPDRNDRRFSGVNQDKKKWS